MALLPDGKNDVDTCRELIELKKDIPTNEDLQKEIKVAKYSKLTIKRLTFWDSGLIIHT